jgi:creatinine amidohydrolase
VEPWRLTECNLEQVRGAGYQVAVLPLGALEPHNRHLPYGTDLFESEHIADRVCAAAWERGARVVLLPAIPYGTERNLAAFPLALNVDPGTLFALVTDLVESLECSGLRKLLLLNSHGGNDLKPLLRQLYGRTEVRLFLCDWYRMIGDVYAEIFTRPDDHAGEMETSLALAYFPDLIARAPDGGLLAGEGGTARCRFRAVEEGWVQITRPWHLYTSDSGAGDPRAAASAKGERLMGVIVERLAPFLVELSAAELDERFPY